MGKKNKQHNISKIAAYKEILFVIIKRAGLTAHTNPSQYFYWIGILLA